MRLIDWRCKDPTPGQQLGILFASLPRVVSVHALWAGEQTFHCVGDVVAGLHAMVARARGLPDPRDLVYEMTPEAAEAVSKLLAHDVGAAVRGGGDA